MLSKVIDDLLQKNQLPTIETIIKKTTPYATTSQDFEKITMYLLRGLYFGSISPYLEILKNNPREYLRAVLF